MCTVEVRLNCYGMILRSYFGVILALIHMFSFLSVLLSVCFLNILMYSVCWFEWEWPLCVQRFVSQLVCKGLGRCGACWRRHATWGGLWGFPRFTTVFLCFVVVDQGICQIYRDIRQVGSRIGLTRLRLAKAKECGIKRLLWANVRLTSASAPAPSRPTCCHAPHCDGPGLILWNYKSPKDLLVMVSSHGSRE